MPTTIQAILLASIIATDDPNADNWETVSLCRAAGITSDRHGRQTIDCLPDLATSLAGWTMDHEGVTYLSPDTFVFTSIMVAA